jgi:hypothetical protein
MARGRDSKGRFKKGRSSKKRRSGRKRRRGVGSIITVRRKGMGAIGADGLMPAAIGGGLSALTALALRWFVNPAGGTTQAMLVKWAPAFGLATGALASMALFAMGGKRGGQDQATAAFTSAAVVSLAGLGSDYLMREKPIVAATVTAPAMAAMAGYGMGAIVPEYSRPTGAIVMEPMGPGGQRAGSIGSFGETVSLAGVDTNAFGTPGFNA